MTVHNFGVETTLTTEQKIQALFRRLRPAAHQPEEAPAPTPAVGAGRPAREHLSRPMARRLTFGGAPVQYEVSFKVPDGAKAGDTVVFQFADGFYSNQSGLLDVALPDGTVIGTAARVSDVNGSCQDGVVVTFNDKVEGLMDVSVKLSLPLVVSQPSPAPAPTPAVGAGRPAREHLSCLMARRLAYIAKHHPEVYFEALENAGKGESK